MSRESFYNWPVFSEEERKTVESVLRSGRVNYWTGQEGKNFEKEFASWIGSDYAIALSNGTVALEIALKALDVQRGDDVIVTPRTFFASASSIVNVGANPIFADVEIENQNISAGMISKILTPNTKAIIVVHLGGLPAEMDDIVELAKKNDISIIEDCAQAHGAKYKGQSVGTIGDIGAWSFCQDKIMTTGGEGGMVTTSSKELWSKMWSLKDHGKSYEAVFNKEHPPGFRWLHESFGSNYRMTEMQAAIGRVQLTKMPEWTRKRQKNASMIDEVAKKFDVVRTLNIPSHVTYAAYKHYLFVNPQFLAKGWTRDLIVEEINKRGVPCLQGSCPEVYLESAFEKTSWKPSERLPSAKLLGETSLMFLVHPELSYPQMEKTSRVLSEVFEMAQN